MLRTTYAPWIRTLNNEAETGGNDADSTVEASSSTDSEKNEEQIQGRSTEKDSDNPTDDFKSIFGDATPAKVKADLDKWKEHARTWEDRAGKSKKDFEKASKELEELKERPSIEDLEALQRDRDAAVREIRLLRTLVEMGQDVPTLTDSRSFMERVQELDSDSDDFRDQLAEIIDALPQRSRSNPFAFRERTPGEQQKQSLWDLVHGAAD